jgi:hypothetical protein
MLQKTRMMRVKYKEVTVVAFITKRNTRRRSDQMARSDAVNVKNCTAWPEIAREYFECLHC